MIGELIANIAGIFSNFFKWKSSGVKQTREAREIVEKDEAAARARRAEINRAVHGGDAETVNRIIGGCGMAAFVAGVIAVGAAAGCASKPPATVYVAADRKVEVITNAAGTAGWFVPNLVMEDFVRSKVELDELKKELKVKEIKQ